jgi:hypothetical protein
MIELLIILSIFATAAVLDSRDERRVTEMQLALDRVHHGTELKPYDWKLEEA